MKVTCYYKKLAAIKWTNALTVHILQEECIRPDSWQASDPSEGSIPTINVNSEARDKNGKVTLTSILSL